MLKILLDSFSHLIISQPGTFKKSDIEEIFKIAKEICYFKVFFYKISWNLYVTASQPTFCMIFLKDQTLQGIRGYSPASKGCRDLTFKKIYKTAEVI